MTTSQNFATPAVTLNDGHSMPLLGLGTWQIADDQAAAAVAAALECGYRHLDTATRYRNEQGVGAGIPASGVPREEVFVTTKFPPDRVGAEREVLEQSLELLGLDHIDLWLVHAPGGEGRDNPLISTWEAFLTAQQEGLVRSVGVSNYTPALIDALVAATGVTPAVNQIRWSPTHHDPDVAEALAERGVALEGYSAFRFSNLDDPVLAEIAAAHDATTAQVIIAWHIAHNWVVIPKSTHPDRIRANAAGVRLELSADEVARIDALRDVAPGT